jgi:hypothetical protein
MGHEANSARLFEAKRATKCNSAACPHSLVHQRGFTRAPHDLDPIRGTSWPGKTLTAPIMRILGPQRGRDTSSDPLRTAIVSFRSAAPAAEGKASVQLGRRLSWETQHSD